METSDEDIDRLVVSGKDSNVDHSGGIVTSEDSEDEVEIAPSTDTNNKVLDDIIPVVDSFPLDENIVESTSDSATLTPNTLPVPDVDNSKVHPTDQTDLSDARSTPQTPPSTKWQDWLQITSDQLSKSMKERGTAALDVLSTLTSSGTIRKRKRNSANPSAGDDTMKTTGVGTLHVELVSAYKVSVYLIGAYFDSPLRLMLLRVIILQL